MFYSLYFLLLSYLQICMFPFKTEKYTKTLFEDKSVVLHVYSY